MNKLKSLWQEFKAFISRGNVVDMAVAVIIGAAFNAIVTSLTNNIIKPLINWAIASAVGGDNIGLVTMLKPVYIDGVVANGIDMANSIYIDWGTFIMKIIDFILIALVLFVIIKVFMGLKNASAKAAEKANKQKEKMVAKLKKQGVSEEEAQAQAEAQLAETAAAAPAAPAQPTTEELLLQIRDLLAAQNGNATVAQVNNEDKSAE